MLPAYRGHHLLEQMTERLSEEAHKLGLIGVYAMPVTIHTFSQRNDERAGMPVCAALLGAASESSRPKDLAAPTAGQRQSLLITFRFLRKPARPKIYPPEPYRKIVLQIYESLGVTVSSCEPAAPTAKELKTTIKVDHRGYGKIHFEQVGPNAGIELKQALQDVRSLGARSVQLSALVDDPGLPLLADRAAISAFSSAASGQRFPMEPILFCFSFYATRWTQENSNSLQTKRRISCHLSSLIVARLGGLFEAEGVRARVGSSARRRPAR